MTLVERAKAAYESTPDSPDEITRPWAKVQSSLRIWQAGLPGPKDAALMALGIVEEYFLEYFDAIDDPAGPEEEARDAIADATVFAMQIASEYRLDWEELLDAPPLTADPGGLPRGVAMVAQAIRKERQAFRSMSRERAREQIAGGLALVARALSWRAYDHAVDYLGLVQQVADKVIARTPVKP